MSLRKRPRSVRVRLTLAYVVAMLAVLAVYAGVVYASVRGSLSKSLDDKLYADFKWPKDMNTPSPEKLRQLMHEDSKDKCGNADEGKASREEGTEEGSPWLQVWSDSFSGSTRRKRHRASNM